MSETTPQEDRERQRLEFLASLDEAEASIARGEGHVITDRESLRELSAAVRRRGMARPEAEGGFGRVKTNGGEL